MCANLWCVQGVYMGQTLGSPVTQLHFLVWVLGTELGPSEQLRNALNTLSHPSSPARPLLFDLVY